MAPPSLGELDHIKLQLDCKWHHMSCGGKKLSPELETERASEFEELMIANCQARGYTEKEWVRHMVNADYSLYKLKERAHRTETLLRRAQAKEDERREQFEEARFQRRQLKEEAKTWDKEVACQRKRLREVEKEAPRTWSRPVDITYRSEENGGCIHQEWHQVRGDKM